MAKTSELSVNQFNQRALRQELASVLIIQNQLHAITQDVVMHYSSKAAKELQRDINAIVGEATRGMLLAESKEVFVAQRRRLESLLGQLQTKLSLLGDLDKALTDFRFYQQLLSILRHSAFSKQGSEWFSNHPEYTEWQGKIAKLQSQKTEQEYADYKHLLIAELLIMQEEQNLANLASLALIKQNIQILSHTRLSYLPEVNDHKKIFGDLAWILVGGLLVTAAAILGLAFPALIIPGIVVGAIVLGYGVVDFSKQNADLLAEAEKLGEQASEAGTTKELEYLEQQFPGFEKEKFLDQQALKAGYFSSEKKLMQGLGYSIAFAGLALGVAGLLAVIPGVGIPIAGLIAITVLAATVTLLATALWGYKVAREQDKLNLMNKEIKEQMIVDNILISTADLGRHKKDEPSSSAKIFLRELEATKQSIESLKGTVTESLDDELEQSVGKETKAQRPATVREQPTDKEDDDDSEGESPPSSQVIH